MIKSLEVDGLNGQFDYKLPTWPDQEEFNSSLNIFTGANGTGKTTLLKLLWYLTSGNLERIFPDIPFQKVKIQTSPFWLSINKVKRDQVEINWEFEDGLDWKFEGSKSGSVDAVLKYVDSETYIEFENSETSVELEYMDEIDKLRKDIAGTMNSSLFLSTFRRIEGGFTTGRRSILSVDESDRIGRIFRERTTDVLQKALADFSSSLSVDDHNFVTSISMRDIVQLLDREDVNLSVRINELQTRTLGEITRKIQEYSDIRRNSEHSEFPDAADVLKNIQECVDDAEKRRSEFSEQFSVLNEIVGDIYVRYGGIRITENLTLHGTLGNEVISAQKLSSGEKQLLGLLCYNAFSNGTIIFLDEPELSLHLDYQKLLLPVLVAQATNTQFFVATHSPQIYARHPDNDINLDLVSGGKQ